MTAARIDKKTQQLIDNFNDLAELGDVGLLKDFRQMGRTEQILTAAQIQVFTAGIDQVHAVRDIAGKVGFDEVHFFDTRTVQGMVLVEDGVAFVAFCGTNELADLIRHSKGSGTQMTSVGGNVQPGYYHAAMGPDTDESVSANSAVQSILNDLHERGKVDELYITGFSDGGNIGTIVATEIQHANNLGHFPLPVSGMFAFDSPPPGDRAYAAVVEETLGPEVYNRISADANLVNMTWNGIQKVVTLGEFVQPDVGFVRYTDGVHSHNLMEMIEHMHEAVGDERSQLVEEIRTQMAKAVPEQKDEEQQKESFDALLVAAGADLGNLGACGVVTDGVEYSADFKPLDTCLPDTVERTNQLQVS